MLLEIIKKKIKEIFLKTKNFQGILKTPPNWITIGITNVCNNKCDFCSYHSDDAKEVSNVYNIPFMLNLADFKRIVNMAYEGKVPRIHICGTGEPFMNPEVLDMIDYCIKVYGTTSIQTNFFKPLFQKKDYLEEILKRKEHISFITTDILSGDPEFHNSIKKGSSYSDVMDSIEYISKNSSIKINISYILTKKNYKNIDKLIDDLDKRRIKNVSININNLYSYDFNEFSSTSSVYTSQDEDITNQLNKVYNYGKIKKIEVNIPTPADLDTSRCNIFWDKIQIWPVRGNDPKRKHENLIPHACRAVVKGELNSLGYIFDYDNIMDMWNNSKLVEIRENILKGKYPSRECRFCHHYQGMDSVFKMKKQWLDSFQEHLNNFKQNPIIKKLNKDSICIDCGANVGSITEVFSQKGATVYSFEPNPVVYKKLKEKFFKNEKVHLFQKAVSIQEENLKLYMYQYNNEDEIFWSVGASTCQSKDDIDQNNYIEVHAINLIEFIKKIDSQIDILKIDIEGGEYDVLLKLIECNLYKKINYILVETHDKHIPEIIPKGNQVRKLIDEKRIKNINLDWY